MLNIQNSSVIYISKQNGDDIYSGFAPYPDGNGNGPIKTVAQLKKNVKFNLHVRFPSDDGKVYGRF